MPTSTVSRNTRIKIQIDSPGLAQENMSCDESLFFSGEENQTKQISLRFYSWKNPAISFGYRQKIEQLIDSSKAQKLNIELIKRITGGGMVLHQPGELTYALVIPLSFLNQSLIGSYKYLSEIIIKALEKIGVSASLASRRGILRSNDNLCFARPVKYEILSGQKKLVGSAQKRGKFVLLQHGSIALAPRLEVFSRLLDCSVIDQGQTNILECGGRSLEYTELAERIGAEFKATLAY